MASVVGDLAKVVHLKDKSTISAKRLAHLMGLQVLNIIQQAPFEAILARLRPYYGRGRLPIRRSASALESVLVSLLPVARHLALAFIGLLRCTSLYQ